MRTAALQVPQWVDSQVRRGVGQLSDQLGGSARLRVVVLLASVLGLSAADLGAIGAVAPQLEKALSISNVQLGLLVTITSLVGAVATIPLGSLVDRTNRVRLLTAVIVVWGVAEAMSGASANYGMLVGMRVALGAVTAAAAPAVASLTGDLFPASERGRIYSFIITGEVIGAGVGVLLSGLLAGWFGWRPAMAILALPSFGLCFALWRKLPEPARGGWSWLTKGAEAIPATREAPDERTDPDETEAAGDDEPSAAVLAAVEEAGIEPAEEIVIERHAETKTLRQALRYVLKIRTNVVMIIATALGYFFFAGLKTFAVLFVRGQYGVSQSLTILIVLVVGVGVVAGVVLAGRLSDKRIGQGHITARIDTGIISYIVAAVILVPAIWTRNLALALPLLVIGGAAIAAPNATLDAARLDVVPAQLWGRAEAVRTALQTVLEAAAPLVFGLVSEQFGPTHGGFGIVASGTKSPAATAAQARGLSDAFLLMLVLLAASGVMLIFARRSYPIDVASAGESQRNLADDPESPVLQDTES